VYQRVRMTPFGVRTLNPKPCEEKNENTKPARERITNSPNKIENKHMHHAYVSSTTRALPRSESATTRISTSRRGKKQRNATSSRNLLVVAQRSADDASETQSPEKKKNSRRAFLNTCACAFCFASSTNAPARAFPKLVEVNESVIQDVLDHRNQQTDKVFAKASAFRYFCSVYMFP